MDLFDLLNTEFGISIKHVARHVVLRAQQLSMRSAYTALLTRTA